MGWHTTAKSASDALRTTLNDCGFNQSLSPSLAIAPVKVDERQRAQISVIRTDETDPRKLPLV